MDTEMDDLKSIWKSAKGNTEKEKVAADTLIRQAGQRKRNALVAHIWNIGILGAVAVMLVYCFYEFFPFQDALSRTGVGFMVGGLILRILIEIFSIVKSNKVKLTDATAKATEVALAFYEFRKKIHGPVTISIVVLYILGFYMLSPEFSRYISTMNMVIMDVGFLIGALIMMQFIKKGNRQELKDLEKVVEIKKALTSS